MNHFTYNQLQVPDHQIRLLPLLLSGLGHKRISLMIGLPEYNALLYMW
jgi:hypothetical protein